jgi:hypothetical protein
MSNQTFDICIPRMNVETSTNYIKTIIHKSKIGEIINYKELLWKNDPTMKRILMTIKLNTNHENHAIWRHTLLLGDYINIVHDFPKMWSLCIAKN